MEVADSRVVSMHYTLTNEKGEVLDSSREGEPLVYLHGSGNIIKGLEKALAGKSSGDKLQVKIPPEEAYGVRDEALIQQVPKRAFQGVRDIRAGMQFQAQGPNGPTEVTVTHVAGDMVTVDGNHALAGETLNFDVEITDVRAATFEEMQHGHVHGAGGHHH
jgi:FKBP-type peptidyl-prolyl cis-trans isomerase SlyD